MKKLLLGFILCLFLCSQSFGQGLSKAQLRSAFYSRIASDTVLFSTAVVDSIYGISAEIVSAHGLAYFRVDNIILAVCTEYPYFLAEPAIWVVGVKPLSSGGSDEVAWSSIDIADVGKDFLSGVTTPAYYYWWGGYEQTKLGVYPKPTVIDTIQVYYFAFADYFDSTQIDGRFEEALVNTALMIGYIRKGQTDVAVSYWNLATTEIYNIRQQTISETKDIMIVPKIKER